MYSCNNRVKIKMTIDLTKKKLREAKFFLQLLEQASQAFVLNDPESFEFYLSAFLSAARSVTFVLQHEEKEKYDAWFPDWFESLVPEHGELLDFLKDKRNMVLKQGYTGMGTTWEYVPVTDITTPDHRHPAYGFHSFAPPGTPAVVVGHQVYLWVGARDVLSTCKLYCELLDRLVYDFTEAHQDKS